MTIFGFIIFAIILLFAWTCLRKEGFEVWPIPSPAEIGAPTAPRIMNFEERVAKGEILSPVPIVQSATYTPVMYNMGAGIDLLPSDYGQRMYNPMLNPYLYGQGLSPLAFGGNMSGSASIGGYGPVPIPARATPASVRGSAELANALAAQPALAALAAQPSSPLTVQAVVAPTASPDTSLQAVIATSTKSGGSRTKAIGEEVDIKGFDWAGLTERAATAFEPTQTVSAAPVTMADANVSSPFETVAANQVLQRSVITPNVTASTAVSLPTISLPLATSMPDQSQTQAPLPQQQIGVLSKQKYTQAMFGSIPTSTSPAPPFDIGSLVENKDRKVVNDVSTAPLFSANAPIMALRGSKNQPGSILSDSRSTQTVIDTTAGQVAAAVATPPMMSVQPSVAVSGTSSVSA